MAMNDMQYELSAMGTDYSQWERLTRDYQTGMEALRRREAGASENMMRIAREMQECQARTMHSRSGVAEFTSFGQSTMRTGLTPVREARRQGWIASTWDVLVPSRRQDRSSNRSLATT